jgi:hypothetical protein
MPLPLCSISANPAADASVDVPANAEATASAMQLL